MTPFEMSAPRVAIATVVARNYLSFARVLALSLRAHHPHVRFLVVVAADPDTDWQLEGEPFEIVALDNLGIPDLRRVCFRCSRQELAVLVKPFLMRHLLDRGIDGGDLSRSRRARRRRPDAALRRGHATRDRADAAPAAAARRGTHASPVN